MAPKVAKPIVIERVKTSKELQELQHKLEAINEVREEINDSRMSTDAVGPAVTGSRAEIDAIQRMRKGNQNVVDAVKQAPIASESVKAQKAVRELTKQMESIADELGRAMKNPRSLKQDFLSRYLTFYDQAEELMGAVTDMSQTAGSTPVGILGPELVNRYNKAGARISTLIGEYDEKHIPTVEELEVRLKELKSEAMAGPATPPAGRTRSKGQTGRGMRHGFKMESDGQFGDVKVDVDELIRLHLKVYDDKGKLVMNKKVDPTFVDLISKRYNPKQKYTPYSIVLFRELVGKSGLPIQGELSGKVKLLYGQSGGCLPADMTREQAVERLQVLTASVEAGNNAPQIKNELADLITYLYQLKAITKKESESLFSDYVVG